MTPLFLFLAIFAGLAAWTFIAVVVALLVGPVLRRSSRACEAIGDAFSAPQAPADLKADDALASDLAEAFRRREEAEPVARAAARAWRIRRPGGRP